MKKPKIYELWFGDYDGNGSWQFTHPNNKLKMEFEQDCEDTLRNFAPAFISNEDSWIGANDLLTCVANNLPSLGYVPLNDSFETICFGMGGSCILKREDYGDESIYKLLGEKLSEFVFEHNDKIENNMMMG